MFVTDGCATSGFNTSSVELLELARSMPAYKSCTINCLGLQLDESGTMNGELLKQMALDTNGTSLLARSAEGLGSFMGNVLYNHYMRRYDRVQIMGTSSNGLKGEMINPPLQGYIISADKPTHALMRWPSDALEPYSIFVHAMPADAQMGFLQASLKCSVSENKATPSQVEMIAGFLGAMFLSSFCSPTSNETKKAPAAAASKIYLTDEFKNSLETLSVTFPSLLGLVSALKKIKAFGDICKEAPAVSQMAYDFSSMGGADVTPTLAYMREQSAAMTVAASQQTEME